MIALQGCVLGIQPDNLKRPDSVTCIEVLESIDAHETYGLLRFDWTTRLVQGPYISEREDADGTYYRAPPGGIYLGRDDLASKPPIPLLPRIFDGGIWIPRSPDKPPRVYTYNSTQEATIVPPPDGASCTNAVTVPDSQGIGVNPVAFAIGGALGGAAGGTIARTSTPNNSISYGQAAGVGAAGGAIGGLIIGALINLDVGRISRRPVSTDPKFVSALEQLRNKIVSVPAGSIAQFTETKP